MYANIRDILGEAVGARILDITQHDRDEWDADGRCYVMLLLDNGCYLKFFIGDDGFDHNCTHPGDEN